MPVIDDIVKASQGNPGALTVLSALVEHIPVFGAAVALKMIRTNSKAPNLWLIYKDECGQELDKTMHLLNRWLALEGDQSLGAWLGEQDLRCSEEARYYS